MLYIVGCFFYFKINFFEKYNSGISLECQTVWIQVWPDVLSDLILVQTVCKRYQQAALVGKEIISVYS